MILAVVMMVVLPLVMAALLVLPPLRPVIVRALGLAPLPALLLLLPARHSTAALISDLITPQVSGPLRESASTRC